MSKPVHPRKYITYDCRCGVSFQRNARLPLMLLGAIVGATGVGKTNISIGVAQQLGAEIICADSRQIYAGMQIGTAQPTQEQRAAVNHHLVDFLSPEESYSAAKFIRDVKHILDSHSDQDFLLVGGTGLYIQALMEGLSELPPADPVLRNRLQKILIRRGLPFLYRWALTLDPAIYGKIHTTDEQRILRVLEVCIQTKSPWTSFQGKRQGGIGAFPVVLLDRPREELYRRIDSRVLSMINEGWLDEVRHLCTQVSMQSPGMQSLGYRQMLSVLLNQGSIESVVPQIQQETRNYAKRQLTWFRNKTPHELILLGNSGEFDQISAVLKYFKKSNQKP